MPSTLVWLSLSADDSTHEVFDEDAVERLLPVLPKSLKSLSLKGSKMETSHLALLLPLTKHLEDLAVGRGLDIAAIKALLIPDNSVGSRDVEDVCQKTWHTIRYLDLSDFWLTNIDPSTLYDWSQCTLLMQDTKPLELLEVHPDVGKRVHQALLKRMGWHSRESGARTWIMRDCATAGQPRPWMMGAGSWSMRKLPVAEADVGGMYGNYMFERKL